MNEAGGTVPGRRDHVRNATEGEQDVGTPLSKTGVTLRSPVGREESRDQKEVWGSDIERPRGPSDAGQADRGGSQGIY